MTSRDYDRILEDDLMRPFSSDIIGVYLVIPSFEPEYAVIIDNENGKGKFEYRKYRENLFQSLQKNDVATYDEKTIKELGDKIREKFKESLNHPNVNNKRKGACDIISEYINQVTSVNNYEITKKFNEELNKKFEEQENELRIEWEKRMPEEIPCTITIQDYSENKLHYNLLSAG